VKKTKNSTDNTEERGLGRLKTLLGGSLWAEISLKSHSACNHPPEKGGIERKTCLTLTTKPQPPKQDESLRKGQYFEGIGETKVTGRG